MRSPDKIPLHSKDCSEVNLCLSCQSVDNWVGLVKDYGLVEAKKIRDAQNKQIKNQQKREEIPVPDIFESV